MHRGQGQPAFTLRGLDAAFAAVDARGIIGDAEITEELMHRVEQENYIPPALAAEYGAAVLAEYRKRRIP